jgi:hypothetical protein
MSLKGPWTGDEHVHNVKNDILERRLTARPDLVGRIGWTNAALREHSSRAMVVTAGSMRATAAKLRALRHPWCTVAAGVDKTNVKTFEGLPAGFILLDDDPRCCVAAQKAGGIGIWIGQEYDMELFERLV